MVAGRGNGNGSSEHGVSGRKGNIEGYAMLVLPVTEYEKIKVSNTLLFRTKQKGLQQQKPSKATQKTRELQMFRCDRPTN